MVRAWRFLFISLARYVSPCPFRTQREGTFFGFDEAKRNFGNIVEGLRRSSDRMDVEDMLADQASF